MDVLKDYIVSNKEILRFRDDYDSMSDMMFGEYPDFDTLIEYIKELESEINNL